LDGAKTGVQNPPAIQIALQLALFLDNKPGSLARICHKLAAAKINIDYAYCATPPDARRGLLVLRVSNAKKALKTLNS